MPLIPYDPFRHIEQWRRDLDKFINTGFGFQSEFGGLPRVDVHETDQEVIAACEIPGLEKKEDVHLHVEENSLTIQGTIMRSGEIKEEQMHRQERFVGRFQRVIPLPARVKAEGTKATYRNGILEVRMPKAGADEKRRIDVEFH